LARGLAGPDPASADLDALGQHPEVRLVLGALGCVGHQVDLGTDAQSLEVALVAAVGLLGDVSDGWHGRSPLVGSRGPSPAMGDRPWAELVLKKPATRIRRGAETKWRT